VSLGSSAVYAVLSIIEKLTRPVPLSQQTTAMNQSATPGRPWLDLAFQLAGIVLPLVVCHAILDTVAFVGYSVLRARGVSL
jgi:hypothetical protein